jgi:hypothetical protein
MLTPLILAAALSAAPSSPPPSALSVPAQTWWRDIRVLAADNMQGRMTGSAGYLRAAAYVERRFRGEGLAPAGDGGGYRQIVALIQQSIDQPASRATLIGPGAIRTPLVIGKELLVSAGGGARPERLSAPLVFIGYGLHLPDRGHDDLAGVDLKGKIAVVVSGGPSDIPGTVKAAARFDRAALLARAGAVGLITLTTPKQLEIPWARQMLLSLQPGMYLADPALRDTPDGFLTASVDPVASERLFEGSGHNFDELAASADASGPLPRFALSQALDVRIVATRTKVTAPNLIAKLEGGDPSLKSQYVAISAHLDHLGVGAPINGDRIYNGAMDDASGVASVLDIAHRLKSGPRPRRSVLFLIVCAEEKGLLGSHYFAGRPTVPVHSIVADLNFDMPLPLWPLKTVIVQGADESTLGADARDAATEAGLKLTPDPLPDRNSFIRTDQFSFVREGTPALAFKFGFSKDTPQFQIEHDWRATRYHSPSDDIEQPGVLKEEAVKLDAYVADIASRIADELERPRWLATSDFKRYAGE